MFDLTDRISPFKMTTNLEDQLEEKNRKLEIITRERDKFECELFTSKSELATVKRTLGRFLFILTSFFFYSN